MFCAKNYVCHNIKATIEYSLALLRFSCFANLLIFAFILMVFTSWVLWATFSRNRFKYLLRQRWNIRWILIFSDALNKESRWRRITINFMIFVLHGNLNGSRSIRTWLFFSILFYGIFVQWCAIWIDKEICVCLCVIWEQCHTFNIHTATFVSVLKRHHSEFVNSTWAW